MLITEFFASSLTAVQLLKEIPGTGHCGITGQFGHQFEKVPDKKASQKHYWLF